MEWRAIVQPLSGVVENNFTSYQLIGSLIRSGADNLAGMRSPEQANAERNDGYCKDLFWVKTDIISVNQVRPVWTHPVRRTTLASLVGKRRLQRHVIDDRRV